MKNSERYEIHASIAAVGCGVVMGKLRVLVAFVVAMIGMELLAKWMERKP